MRRTTTFLERTPMSADCNDRLALYRCSGYLEPLQSFIGLETHRMVFERIIPCLESNGDLFPVVAIKKS
jgi:hypothetical protein